MIWKRENNRSHPAVLGAINLAGEPSHGAIKQIEAKGAKQHRRRKRDVKIEKSCFLQNSPCISTGCGDKIFTLYISIYTFEASTISYLK